MTIAIIPADQRAIEKSGVKAVVLGPYGIGKTSLLRTLDPETTLFVDGEAGDLAVQDVECDTIRPLTWPDCRNVAAMTGGPNPAFPSTAAYSQAHYDSVVNDMGDGAFDKYETVFIDSLTKLSRICLQWCQQQPDAQTAQGKADNRAAYGLLGREMLGFLTQVQHARRLNVIVTCAMEQTKDDFGRLVWEPHVEGSKTMRELPGIVDEVISYMLIPFGEGPEQTMERCFITSKANTYGVPAKDRSGRLDELEPPHLGKLIAKASVSRS